MTRQSDLYDMVMLQYATGALPAAAAMVVSAHLKLRPQARAHIHGYDAVGGALLDAVDIAAPMAADAAAVLARAAAYDEQPARPHPVHALSGVLADPEPGEWRRVLPGMHERPFPGAPGASLLRLAAGRTVPEHDHEGLELALVLKGSFADEHGVYQRGDLAVADAGLKHRPRVPGDQDCICLSASAGEIVPSSWLLRALKALRP